jgi:hypothetical protein
VNVIYTILLILTFIHHFVEVGMSGDADIEKIPDPVPKPCFASSSNLKNISKPSVVVLDLETTGLSKYF